MVMRKKVEDERESMMMRKMRMRRMSKRRKMRRMRLPPHPPQMTTHLSILQE